MSRKNLNVTLKKIAINGEEPEDIIFDGKPLTAQRAILVSLISNYPEERAIDGKEKAARALLAMRVAKEREPELKAKEISKIMDLVGKAWGPEIVLPVYELLDGKQDGEVEADNAS